MLVVKRGLPAILAYSCKANNHVLNSLGCGRRAPRSVSPRRLSDCRPFSWALRSLRPSTWAWRAMGAETSGPVGHPGRLSPRHRQPLGRARGYAGAMLGSLIACCCFASPPACGWSYDMHLLRCHSAVAAVGFVTTTILVPLAHGLVAMYLATRQIWLA